MNRIDVADARQDGGLVVDSGDFATALTAPFSACLIGPGTLQFLAAEARALVGLGRVADVHRAIDQSLSITAGAGPQYTPGDVIEGTAQELRAHGYRDESLKLAARAIDWYRSRPPDVAASHAHRAGLARSLYLAERWDEARALLIVLAAENPGDVRYVAYLGSIAARTNDPSRARGFSAELARLRSRDVHQHPFAGVLATYGLARIAALLGEPQRAVDLLRDALTQGFAYGLDIHSDADLESLRTYKPFVEMVRPSE